MGADAKLAAAILLGSFGIAAPVDQFLAGLFLAHAAAFLVMYFTDPGERKTYALTLLSALVCALIAAVVHATIVPNWSLHLMMAIAGGLSTYVVESARGFGGSMIGQISALPARIADRVMGKGKADE